MSYLPGMAIYSDCEPIIWLPVENVKTKREALRVAWSGDGIEHGFREDGVLRKELEVRRVWMKSTWNDGEWWEETQVTDVADLTEFFRVECV